MSAATIDVVFAFDAHERMGFGHASRCLRIAELAAAARPGLRFGVLGELAGGACARVRAKLPAAELLPPGAQPHAVVSVVDHLTDTEDPESIDAPLAARLARTSQLVIALASGTHVPAMPEGAVLIGYQPGGPPPNPPGLLWGLQYAPVAATPDGAAAQASPGRVLIALGGAEDDRCLRSVIAACARLEDVRVIDVLLSPVMPVDASKIAALDGRLRLHEGLPSVAPLLRAAEIIVTSYGHLMWEAMAHGAAVCVLGQKRFQTEWSARLAEHGCVIDGGDARHVKEDVVLEALRTTRARGDALRARARAFVDGKGLERIAALVVAGLGRTRLP